MPRVLTTSAVITCPHGGLGTSTPLTPWWKVFGGTVLQENDTGVLACPFVFLPCVGYRLGSMGLNTSSLGSRRVILETDFQQSVTGLPLLITETHPVFDDSTPAVLPPGVPAPPLSPAMRDSTRPTVVVTPATPPVVVQSTGPPPLPLSFAIASPFPSRWQLMWLNQVNGVSTDLTNGSAAGVDVVPDGGVWDEPTKTVLVTLSPAFLVGIQPTIPGPPGKNHRFVLIAINQRGLWGSAEVAVDAKATP